MRYSSYFIVLHSFHFDTLEKLLAMFMIWIKINTFCYGLVSSFFITLSLDK
jgi:hypothetical protein